MKKETLYESLIRVLHLDDNSMQYPLYEANITTQYKVPKKFIEFYVLPNNFYGATIYYSSLNGNTKLLDIWARYVKRCGLVNKENWTKENWARAIRGFRNEVSISEKACKLFAIIFSQYVLPLIIDGKNVEIVKNLFAKEFVTEIKYGNLKQVLQKLEEKIISKWNELSDNNKKCIAMFFDAISYIANFPPIQKVISYIRKIYEANNAKINDLRTIYEVY